MSPGYSMVICQDGIASMFGYTFTSTQYKSFLSRLKEVMLLDLCINSSSFLVGEVYYRQRETVCDIYGVRFCASFHSPCLCTDDTSASSSALGLRGSSARVFREEIFCIIQLEQGGSSIITKHFDRGWERSRVQYMECSSFFVCVCLFLTSLIWMDLKRVHAKLNILSLFIHCYVVLKPYGLLSFVKVHFWASLFKYWKWKGLGMSALKITLKIKNRKVCRNISCEIL